MNKIFDKDSIIFENIDDVFNNIFKGDYWSLNRSSLVGLTEPVSFDVPGFNKDNIEVTINDGWLTIKGYNESLNRELSKRVYAGTSVKNINISVVDGVMTITPELKTDDVSITFE